VPPQVTNYYPVTGAMIITASHNPSQYNGMKMTYAKSSLNEEQIKEVINNLGFEVVNIE
jgi:phosphomannomutase